MTSKAELVRQHPHLSEDELAEKLDCSVFYVRQQRALVKSIKYRPGSFWTPERDKTLRELWVADAHSAEQIARILGEPASRNSVIGRAHRVGLPAKAGRARGKAKGASLGVHPRETIARINNARKGKPFVLWDRPQMKLIVDPTPLPQPNADDIARVSFDDLERHHCRWIVLEEPAGPFVKQFCGLTIKTPGISYCPAHYARSFSQVRLREQQIPADSNVIVLRKREEVAA
jgi:hypothetical protein